MKQTVKTLLRAAIASAIMFSCKEKEEAITTVPPTVAFSADKDSYTVGETVYLTDYSTPGEAPIVEHFWNFGITTGATKNFSQKQNASVFYTKKGKYVVKLTVTDKNGTYATKADTVTVLPADLPVIDPNAPKYFVKVAGSGAKEGSSWDNALDLEGFRAMVQQPESDGNVFYLAGGLYQPTVATTLHNNHDASAGYFISILNKNITLVGGFDPDITGSGIDMEYPTATPTIFSGDMNNNSINDDGDCRVLYIQSTTLGKKVMLYGITVSGGRSSNNTADYYRPGIHINGTAIDMLYCTVKGNISTIPNTVNTNAGGAGLFVGNSSAVYCYKTVFTNNQANNRGGAIRMLNGVNELILESCLLSGNSLSPIDYGSAIFMANGNAYLINTTVTGNHATGKGAAINQGGGAVINGALYLISSTVAGNTCGDNTQGLDIRAEGTVYTYNSIITSNPESGPCIYSHNANGNIISAGYNILGSVIKSGTGSDPATVATDALNTYAEIFDTNGLTDNGGYPQTIAPRNAVTGATVAELEAIKEEYELARGDVSKDQRGFARSSSAPTSKGAYDAAATNN